MKQPTATQFKRLLLSAMDFSGYDLQEPDSDQQRVEMAANIMRSELGHMFEQGYSMHKVCLHWLQGLASACTIPFANYSIVKWWEQCTGEQLKDDDQCIDACGMYWAKAANALAVMFERVERGYKIGLTI